jgi:hypothetical protein
MFHTKDPQTSDTTIQNLVAMMTWYPGSVVSRRNVPDIKTSNVYLPAPSSLRDLTIYTMLHIRCAKLQDVII